MSTDCSGLRLLLVGPYPPPFGGIASHLTMLIPGLRARGATDIAVVSFGVKDSTEAIDGGTLYRVDARRHLRRLAAPSNWGSALQTLAVLAGAKLSVSDIVREAVRTQIITSIAARHASQVISYYQSDTSLSLLPCSEVWGRSRGTVLTVFGECYDNPAFFEGRPDFVQKFLDRPYAVTSSSKHCARSFRKFGIDRLIEPVYYGIDLERFSSVAPRQSYRQQLAILEDELLVTYMGRFAEEMGLGRLLEIGTGLLAHQPKMRLLLAGAKGPLAGAAADFATRNAGRVTVIHDVPFDLQPAIYAASDIVLAPSSDQHACMGMSIKEAMAASRPVIGSNAGGIPEAIVDGETGVLVPLDSSKHIDSDLLRAAIDLLAGDPALRSRMGAAGRKRAEDIFAMDVTIDRMAGLFMAARPR